MVDQTPADSTPQTPSAGILPNRGVLVLVLGIIALLTGCIGLILGPIAWIMGRRDLRLMAANEMDPAGKTPTRIGLVLGIIATILSPAWLVFTIILLLLLLSREPAAPFIYTLF